MNPADFHGKIFWRVILVHLFGGSFWRIYLAGFHGQETSKLQGKEKANKKKEKSVQSVDL